MEDIPQEIVDERHTASRRDFLKRSAAAGAVAWAAPAISTLSSGAAWAQQDGYDEDCCEADATALFVRLLGTTVVDADAESLEDAADGCIARIDTGDTVLGGALRVEADVVCATVDEPRGGPCVGEATLARVAVHIGRSVVNDDNLGGVVGDLLEALDLGNLLGDLLNGDNGVGLTIEATVLTAEATARCGGCATAESSIATLTINGEDILDLAVCNLSVLGLITINEQECDGDTITVRALHIDLGDLLEVIVSEAQAGGTGCCETCDDNNT